VQPSTIQPNSSLKPALGVAQAPTLENIQAALIRVPPFINRRSQSGFSLPSCPFLYALPSARRHLTRMLGRHQESRPYSLCLPIFKPVTDFFVPRNYSPIIYLLLTFYPPRRSWPGPPPWHFTSNAIMFRFHVPSDIASGA
jgi:hypothetical protein